MTRLTQQQIKNLIEDADDSWWYANAKNVFEYEKDGKWTLIQDGEVLIKNADYVWWYAKNVFEYFKGGEYKKLEINN